MLREITFADLPRLAELEKECFAHSPWSLQMLKESISLPSVYKTCIEINGMVEAYLIVGYNDWESEIFTIGVSNNCRRQGLAKTLLQNLKDFCLQTKKESIFLEVRKSNISAQQLYVSFGFKQIAIRKNYYENTEDAIIMEYKISES